MMQVAIKKITLHTVLLLVILLVAIANRFYGLDRLSLWADELWVVMESSKGTLLDMFSFVYYHDNHPPGHYLFTRYWQMIFGNDDFTIRFPFAIAGVFLVYSVFVIGKEHYSPEAGLVAAALVSSSWQAIYYSQEARANIMVAVATLWALHYFYSIVLAGNNNKKNRVGFWLSSTIACYLHYSGLVYVACLALVYVGVLLVRRRKTDLVLALTLFLPVLVLYTPWMPGMFYHLTHKPAGAWWQTPEWNYLYENFKWIFGFGSRILLLYQLAFILLIVCAVLVAINKKRIYQLCATKLNIPEHNCVQSLQFSLLLLLMMVMPVMVFFIKSRLSQPVYDYRHFIYTLPLMAMASGFLLSLLLMRLADSYKKIAMVFIIFFLLLNQNYYNILGKLYAGPHFKAEYRQTVATLVHGQSGASSGTMFIIANSNFFNHYLQRSLNGKTANYLLTDSEQVPLLNEEIRTQKPAVIYFLETPETRERDMVSVLDNELATFYRPLCRQRFIYAQVIKFAMDAPSTVEWNQLPVCN